MNAFSATLSDTTTMFRRDIAHALRYFSVTLSGLLVPVIMLLLFAYFFGGAIGSGQNFATHVGTYINYLAPGIIIMTIGSGCSMTALNLCMDLSEGLITRLRTMAIAPTSVLTGQVLGSLLRTLLTVILVFAVALLVGFRPVWDLLAWLEAFGLIVLLILAITWMGMAFGLVGKTPAGANSLALLFQILAFTSSAFVSPDSMPVGVRWFAEYQPFTPIIDSLRELLLGMPVDGNRVLLGIAWCLGLTLLGFFWARTVYNRNSTR